MPAAQRNPKPVSPLGVGVPYFASVPEEVYRPGLLDFVEVTPETLCRQTKVSEGTVFHIVEEQFAMAQKRCKDLPLTVHGVELSIGSVHRWNDAYLQLLDTVQNRWPFAWHSEHLGFQTIEGTHGDSIEVGVPLPLPPTNESVDLVVARSRAINERYKVPFLLENPAHYLPNLPADEEIGGETGMMAAITERAPCFQLLDLHNVYCNQVNLGSNAFVAIDEMPLSRVLEIHIAGGSWQDGFWVDAHDGRVPEQVWELLEYTVPKAPNLAGIVFEMLEEYAVRFGIDMIVGEVERAREIWSRHREPLLSDATP